MAQKVTKILKKSEKFWKPMGKYAYDSVPSALERVWRLGRELALW
jgi:hypothetical protein